MTNACRNEPTCGLPASVHGPANPKKRMRTCDIYAHAHTLSWQHNTQMMQQKNITYTTLCTCCVRTQLLEAIGMLIEKGFLI